MPAPLGDEAHAGAGQRVGRRAVDLAAASNSCPADGTIWPLQTAERRRLARAVRPEQRVHLPRLQHQVDAVQHVDACRSRRGCRAARAVRVDRRHGSLALGPQRCRGRRPARRDRPGSRAVCPCAMTRPKSSTLMCSHASITNGMSCSTSSTPSPSATSSRRSRAERVGLVLVEPRRRLVEQQHLRARSRARGRARRGAPCRSGGCSTMSSATSDDADPLEQLLGDRRSGRTCSCPTPCASRARRSTFSRVLRLSNASSRWNVRAMPSRARLNGVVSVMSRAVEHHPPGGRRLQPGDDVEQRRLAGAVRPDQPGDAALRHLDVGFLAARRARRSEP